MGTFAALSGVIGKTKNEVLKSLEGYTLSNGGGLIADGNMDFYDENCCIVEEAYGNTTIYYPYACTEWEESSKFISKQLNVCVFSLHIHDGDFWMYVMFNNGEIADQFNPVPDYWEENISDEEILSWKGDASVIADCLKYINPDDIKNYLVRWDLEDEENSKAYPDDEFAKEDWQLLDFMKKLKLPYPVDANGKPAGQTFAFWTNQLKLKPKPNNKATKEPGASSGKSKGRQWWEFWKK